MVPIILRREILAIDFRLPRKHHAHDNSITIKPKKLKDKEIVHTSKRRITFVSQFFFLIFQNFGFYSLYCDVTA
jgi:hypothetical protein